MKKIMLSTIILVLMACGGLENFETVKLDYYGGFTTIENFKMGHVELDAGALKVNYKFESASNTCEGSYKITQDDLKELKGVLSSANYTPDNPEICAVDGAEYMMRVDDRIFREEDYKESCGNFAFATDYSKSAIMDKADVCKIQQFFGDTFNPQYMSSIDPCIDVMEIMFNDSCQLPVAMP